MAGRRNALLLGGVALGAFFLWPKSMPTTNPFETQASRNVANAFSSAGGSTTHTPAVATKRGDSSDTKSPQLKSKGVGTAHFDENQAAQKIGEAGIVEKAYRGAQYGNDKGK